MTAAAQDFVVVLALGPVQGFIAAARRSRDLWAGSWILSELGKAAAEAWRQEPGLELIFPSVQDPELLRPGSAFNVGNKLRAILRGADEARVRAVVQRGAQAACARWEQLVDEVWDKLGHASGGLRPDIWQAQRSDWVEAYGAWARLSPQPDGRDYVVAAQAAERALGARKATRDFVPAALRADDESRQLPKSSLDGARETVLREGTQLSQRLRRQLGLSGSEQLDVTGVVKRWTGRTEHFTPLTRVVADDWLRILAPQEREALVQAWEPLVELQWATRVKGNQGCYADFPYDAALCWRSRMRQALAEAVEPDERQALLRLQEVLQPLWRRYGEPVPYGVLMQADGDRMGELLDAVSTLQGHRLVAASLSAFAQSVPGLVRQHRGHAIYAGGDDVLAMVPLSQAVECAQVLARAFAGQMRQAAQSLGLLEAAVALPSLSVGLALVHVMEPLGIWRAQALAAEQVAKGDHEAHHRRRNALCLRLLIRAGHLVQVRARWDDECSGRDVVGWLQRWREILQLGAARQLPSRLPYDLKGLVAQGQRWIQGYGNDNDWTAWAQAEWALLLQRARTPTGKPLEAAVVRDLNVRLRDWIGRFASRPAGDDDGGEGRWPSGIEPRAVLRGMESLADELILARWLAARSSRDLDREAR